MKDYKEKYKATKEKLEKKSNTKIDLLLDTTENDVNWIKVVRRKRLEKSESK